MATISVEQYRIPGTLFLAEHAYLVFRDDQDREYVLRAGHDGFLGWFTFEIDIPLESSSDSRGTETRADRHSRTLSFDGKTADEAWTIMCEYARLIQSAGLDYKVDEINSNTFVAAMIAAAGRHPGISYPTGSDGLVGWANYASITGAFATPENAVRDGTDYADYISGFSSGEVIQGYSGADYLAGRGGNDLLIGGGHGDRYSVGADEGYDIIDDRGGGGVDVLILYTGAISNTFVRSWFRAEGDDLLVQVPNLSEGGWAINVRIRDMGSSANRIERVEIWGGSGDQPTAEAWDLSEIWAQETRRTTPDTPEPGDGGGDMPAPEAPSSSSAYTWTGSSAANLFIGTGANDVVRGLDGADVLSGEGGNDTLLGNGGADVLNGGDGDDLLIDDDPGSLSVDNLAGGAGDDTLVFYGAPGSHDFGDGGSGRDMAYVDLSDRTRDWRLSESNGDIEIRLEAGTSEGSIELENIEVIAVRFGNDDDVASVGDDIQAWFEGGDGDDTLYSGDNDDYLAGGDGDDKLDGDRGVDWLDGGDGNDHADIDLAGETRDLTFVADMAADEDGFTFENGTHVRNVERIDLFTGSGDDRIWLGDDVDDVDTGGGDDVVTTTLRGRDSVVGGSGYDRMIVDFSDGEVALRVDYDIGDNDFQVSAEDAYTSALHRVHVSRFEEIVLLGGRGADRLEGGVGDDDLVGADGDDRLAGGAGADRLEGGAGEDRLTLDGGADFADGGAGIDQGILDRFGSGLDVRFDVRQAATSSGYTLADGAHARNIEKWDITLGTGDDVVTVGGSGARFIDMGIGGQDRIVIDHRGQSSSIFVLQEAGFVPSRLLVSTGLRYEAATDRFDVREAETAWLFGGSGLDELWGLGGADQIDGGAGDDIVYAGGGADLIQGGLGQDRIYGQGGADIFVFGAADSLIATRDVLYDFASGEDRLDLGALYDGSLWLATATDGVSTYLYADLDTDGVWDFAVEANGGAVNGGDILISALGTAPIGLAMFGHEGADTLRAGAGDDQIYAGAGDDLISGGGGHDRVDGGSGFDTFTVSGAREDYVILQQGDDFILKGADGGARLVGIELVRFGDGAATDLARLYEPEPLTLPASGKMSEGEGPPLVRPGIDAPQAPPPSVSLIRPGLTAADSPGRPGPVSPVEDLEPLVRPLPTEPWLDLLRDPASRDARLRLRLDDDLPDGFAPGRTGGGWDSDGWLF